MFLAVCKSWLKQHCRRCLGAWTSSLRPRCQFWGKLVYFSLCIVYTWYFSSQVVCRYARKWERKKQGATRRQGGRCGERSSCSTRRTGESPGEYCRNFRSKPRRLHFRRQSALTVLTTKRWCVLQTSLNQQVSRVFTVILYNAGTKMNQPGRCRDPPPILRWWL